MPTDLNAIYEEAGAAAGEQKPDQEDPKPKIHPSDAYLQRRQVTPQNMSRAGASFKVEGVTYPDQDKFFGKTGISDPALTGENIALEAGARQSFGNKLGRRLVNLVPNIAANMLDIVGSVGSLLTEWGDERDYRNGLNELADSMKNPAGENYKRSNDTWAIGDPTWWIDHAFNTIEYAAPYAVAGIGTAKLLGAGAKGLGNALKVGTEGSQWLTKAAQLGTSGLVSYAQGAQSGAAVFKEVYDNQFTKAIAEGQSPEQAKETATHIAAQSAATTAQLSTLLTMGINAGAYAPLFRSQEGLSRDIIASRLVGMERTSFKELGTMIRGMNASNYADRLLHHKGVRGLLDEMWREGGEEVLQQFAEKTGSDIGKKGQIHNFLEQFGEIENLVDRTANSEGLLAFTLGAAFGGIQHTLIHNVIPSKRVDRLDANGNPIVKMSDGEPVVDNEGKPVFEKTWVTPRRQEADFTEKAFNSVRDSIAADFERMEELKNEFLAGRKEGNEIKAEEARDEMFRMGKLHAVKNGMTEPWIKTFDTISEMTPEQAVEAGYAMDINDVSYQQKAKDAATDMNKLQKIYVDLNKRYGIQYENNQGLKPFVDMVFARTADLMDAEKRIKVFEEVLTKQEAEESNLAWIGDIEMFNELSNKYVQQHNSAVEVRRQLQDDLNELQNAAANNKPDSVDRLLRKYRAVGFAGVNKVEAVKDLVRKLKAKNEQLNTAVSTAEEAMLNSTDYNEWVKDNPDGSFDAYMQEVNKRYNLNTQNRYKRAHLESEKVKLDIAKQNLRDVTNEKNATRFMKKAVEYNSELKKEYEALQKERAARLAALAKDKAMLSRLEKIKQNQIAEKHRNDRDALYKRIADNVKRQADLKRELMALRNDPMRASAIRRILKDLETEQKLMTERAAVLDSLYKTTMVDETDTVVDMAVEEVSGEENGKTVMDDEAQTTGTTTQTIPVVTPTVVIPELQSEQSFEDELAALAANATDPSFDPFADYNNLLTVQKPAVQQKMNVVVDSMMTGEFGFSLDALNPEIQAGLINQPEAHKLLLAARDYVAEMQRLLQSNDATPSPDTLAAQAADQTLGAIVNGMPPADTPEVSTGDESMISPESPTYHAGFKIVEAATSGATSTIGYEEGTKRGKDGTLVYVKVTKPTELNKTVNENILKSDKLKPGHKLKYVVDVEYSGPALVTDQLTWDTEGNPVQELETAADYLDDKGKVKILPSMVGNVPIKVIDAGTGETLFHIHKMDWINAKYPGTTNYRNVVDIITLPDGTVVDNISIQRDQLYALRQQIVTRFNTDGSPTDGEIAEQGKGTGRLIMNHVVESKDADNMLITSKVVPELAYNRNKPEESMLPEDGTLVVVLGEKEKEKDRFPYAGKDFIFKHELGFDKRELSLGGVGQMVKSANGQYMYAPLRGMKLVEPGKPSPALTSVARAIELYILNDGSDPAIRAEIDDLQKNTNFNVGTTQGLKAFINQYFTYTNSGFADSALSPNANTGERSERFVFSIDDTLEAVADKTKRIKVGFTMRGDGAHYANLVDGKLSPDFVNILAEGFAQRSRAVVFTDPSLNIRGINSSGFFYDANYIEGKGWKHNQYDSYNQYVKSWSKTPVYGRNRLSDGTYVYTANPHLNITIPGQKVTQPVVPVVKPNQTVTQVNNAGKSQEELDADLLDELGNMSLARNYEPKPVTAIGTGSDNSIPLSLVALEEKYNFTPEAQRNGKTVREVFEELSGRGHTYLSDGYNPFSRCL